MNNIYQLLYNIWVLNMYTLYIYKPVVHLTIIPDWGRRDRGYSLDLKTEIDANTLIQITTVNIHEHIFKVPVSKLRRSDAKAKHLQRVAFKQCSSLKDIIR